MGRAHHAVQARFDNHRSITREFGEIPKGVAATTTRDGPAIAGLIPSHVRQMKQRLESGHGMRWFDPLFLVNHDIIDLRVEELPAGYRSNP